MLPDRAPESNPVPIETPQGTALAQPEQILDVLSLSNVAHNLHYKAEQNPLSPEQATQYAQRLLEMVGYRNPDLATVQAAIQAWQQLYPQDSSPRGLNQGLSANDHSYSGYKNSSQEHIEYQEGSHRYPNNSHPPHQLVSNEFHNASNWRISEKQKQIKLWVDDTRKPPEEGWEWAQSADAAESILATEEVAELSLDFDLPHQDGEIQHDAANGADVAAWAIRHNVLPETVHIHSANPLGIEEIKLVLGDHPYSIKPLEPNSDESMNHNSATQKPNKDDKQATTVHLLDTVLHNLKHVDRHLRRFEDPKVQKDPEAIQFNYEHAIKHLEETLEHADKLVDHLKKTDVSSDSFKDEAKEFTTMSSLWRVGNWVCPNCSQQNNDVNCVWCGYNPEQMVGLEDGHRDLLNNPNAPEGLVTPSYPTYT